ncbi:MAG: hypothetical protein J5552_06050 [Prevotella sp.]|nr:hypothetical protein [Prevotella sp.]
MRRTFYIYYLSCIVLMLGLSGCDHLVEQFVDVDEMEDFIDELKPQHKEAMQVHKVEFSPDYKTFVVTTRMYDDIGPYSLMDSSRVRVSVTETVDGIKKHAHSLPRLIAGRNLKGDNISKAGIKLLTLVDATLPQSSLDRLRDYVTELRAVFNHHNLYIAFMQGYTVSESMEVTDYILENYFKKDLYLTPNDQHPKRPNDQTANSPNDQFICLYRSILQKQDEMNSNEEPWADAKKKVLLIFSDERVYDDETDMPLDPDHYLFQEQMVHQEPNAIPDFLCSYASMRPLNEAGESQESIVIREFCQHTHGIFMPHYSGTTFKNNVLNTFNVSPDANEFTFENPDGKVYRGNIETLTVLFSDSKTDSLITSFSASIQEGNIFNPIIVHGHKISLVIAQSILLAIFILLIVWLLFQLLIPFIRYRLFLHKYVVRYTGSRMGFGMTAVHESCYLCKQPFETGDEIVVKCSHTMHKTCWDENQYHCPEYSDRCKEGVHYYNPHNLLDRHNAPYYMKWIIMAIVAAWLAWLVFITREHTITHFLVTKMLHLLYGVQEGSKEAAALLYQDSISPLSAFGFAIGFFLTLGIAVLSVRLSEVLHHFGGVLLRAVIAAVSCYLVFLVASIVIAVVRNELVEILLEWIPWTLSGFIIAYCGTHGTRVVLRKSLILPGIAIGIISMYVWWLFFDSDVDYRVLLLISFMVYAVGLAVSIASVSPRSDRFFLKVQGDVKEMDIAIYKWFRNAPDRVVTIGKSVDCSLQLSWDLRGHVAPVHAEIRMKRSNPFILAIEDGVLFSGKPIAVGKKRWLYHGDSFIIGNTMFTYIEKDL